MKQFILLALAISVFTISKAQITKGSTMVGGNLSLSTSKTDYTDTTYNKSNRYSFGISYAKCFEENTFWGINGSISYSENKYIYSDPLNNSNSTNRNFYIGVFARKYYPLLTNLFLIGQTGLGYSISNNDNYSTSKGYNIVVYAYPGISFKAFKKIYLETTLSNLINIGYSHSETSNSGTTSPKNNSFSADIQLPTQILQNLNVGMTIILGK